MELTQLPDDALVMAMQYVDVQDLLALRLVCKRLGGLALHRDVWRHRRLNQDDACVCPVLRLAPCLDTLEAAFPSRGCFLAYTMTSCAFAGMELLLDNSMDAMLAAMALCRQQPLGRLRRLEISFADSNFRKGERALMGALASTFGLEELKIINYTGCSGSTAKVVAHSSVRVASLKRFTFDFEPEAVPFLDCILSVHAATLEEVDFCVYRSVDTSFSAACTSVAPLLACCMSLRKLSSMLIPGLGALGSCKALRFLHLTIHPDKTLVAEVAQFLRSAEHLREVKLTYQPALRSATDVGGGLVLALASSGRSRLEALSVQNDDSSKQHFPLLEPLFGALPSLQHLQRLGMSELTLEERGQVLELISPVTAPALGLLELASDPSGTSCAHAWLHSDVVRATMKRNPLLHVKIMVDFMTAIYCTTKHCSAPCASLRCHEELVVCRRKLKVEDYEDIYLILFSHDPRDGCSQDHRAARCECVHIPRN
ncbi:uncharacterized protein LOC113207325 [Frankliniella occidentalis]|uniref:Uncharacterized protein LOC113207325 n=1 Tax=Frankliniella occidentalis TaxID=133901 RepID=A0A6J1SM70_FRAOC|nr:uncharacterized protein LOC113207325 [Frankliniella occidentalis]